LLDTDIGSDIDDAVCLAYLLAQPECDLLGITTVSGEPEKRAMIASALCRSAGRAVPIYPGADAPLLIPQRQPVARQAEALPRWEHDRAFPQGQAVEFLRRTIRAHPHEVVLLTIGPLTNVGLLFALDREIPRLLKGLVMMAGAFAGGLSGRSRFERREWNASLDPHAAAVVFQAPLAGLRAVGLDVTSQVTLDAAEVRRKFQADRLRPVLDFAEVWFQSVDHITFHDPLAAAVLFDPSLCRFEKGTVEVELASERLLGLTHWTPGGSDAPHEVAFEVDAGRFFEHCFSVLGDAERFSGSRLQPVQPAGQ
jgi:inosine-uridine nucleoside N-ribohydrolase